MNRFFYYCMSLLMLGTLSAQAQIVTDEEMERRAREREMEQQAQRDGLPQRRAEMAGLHRQVADSHAPGATPAKPAERGEGDGGQSA